MPDEGEAQYELLAIEWLLRNTDMDLVMTDTNQTEPVWAWLKRNIEKFMRVHARSVGASGLSQQEFIEGFMTVDFGPVEMRQNALVNVWNQYINKTDHRIVGYDDIAKGIFRNQVFLQSVLAELLFTGTIASGGGSCQITHRDNKDVTKTVTRSAGIGMQTPMRPGECHWIRPNEEQPCKDIEHWQNFCDEHFTNLLADSGNFSGIMVGISSTYHGAKACG